MMNRRQIIILTFTSFVLLTCSYNNCLQANLPFLGGTKGTESGNPMTSTQIVAKVCATLGSAHPEMPLDQCFRGVFNTSISQTLGVPQGTMNPFKTLETAEQAGAIRADMTYFQNCLSAIDNLDPRSQTVQSAYDPSSFNPFNEVAAMIPASIDGCPKVYSNNVFTFPSPTPPPPGTVVVNFDDAQPTSDPDISVKGVFQGIDFGTIGDWQWSLPFDGDTTNFLLPSADTPPQSFSFSGGPKTLVSIDFFSSKTAGVVTVSDDMGQTASLFVPTDSQMHTLVTGFAKPSNIITIDFPVHWSLAMDNITYKIPDTPPLISYIQGNASDLGNQSLASLSFASSNTKGNLLVVQTNWASGFGLVSVDDSQGDVWAPATAVGTSANGNHQQIWYAKNIDGGPNSVTVHFLGTSGSSNFGQIYIFEYSGLDPVSPLDVSVTATGINTTPADSGPATIGFPNELIFGGIQSDSAILNHGPGFVTRSNLSNNLSEDMIVTAAGTYRVTGISDTNGWIAQMVAFKARGQ